MKVLIIGAGMSGLLSAIRLQQAGVAFEVIEKNADVGGTWLENTYPGCRVDNPSHLYSYSFEPNHEWPMHFSTQPVLRDYFKGCADKHNLRPHIRFNTQVVEAHFDEAAKLWRVKIRKADGTEETLVANAVISAVGQLNQPSIPDIPGAGDFAGASFHSARWDYGTDLRGKRVAVIGSGASAFQVIPSIAGDVGELQVFLRNPPWIVPTPNYHATVSPGLAWLFRAVPYYSRWFRFYQFWTSVEGRRDFAAVDPGWDQPGSVSAKNQRLRETLTRYLMREYADRPDLQQVMIPRHPPYGKRMLRDNGVWAQALKQPNVSVVSGQIERITPAGIVTADGTEHELDVIVYCTGFQAWRFLDGIEVTGRDGADLHQRWGQDPAAYLGVTVPGFPNLFCLYGPNTNLVVNGSIVMFSECAVHYVLECLRLLLNRGDQVMDLHPAVLDAYQRTVDEANALMAWGAEGVDNWYKSPTGRVSQNWPLATIEYWDLTRAPDPGHYQFTGPAGA
jgi:4-hydroxyacetophenone monooxygenase